MNTEEQQGFEVVDKRGKDRESDSIQSSSAEAPEGEAEQVEIPGDGKPDVPGLLTYVLSILGASSWQCLGLIANPVTHESEVDLEQAKLAIDAFEFLSEKLKPYLDDRTYREVRQSLADLQANYVSRSRSGQ